MDHLKFFEEIKSDVFRSAARKLRNLQHLKRAEMMDDWAKQREIQEAKDRWEKRIEDYSPEGKFRFRILSGSTQSPIIIEEDFYLYLAVEEVEIVESITRKPDETTGNVCLTLGLIPINQKSLDMINSKLQNPFFWNGFFWCGNLRFDFYQRGDDFQFTQFHKYLVEDYGDVRIANRQTAVKLRKILIDIFSGKETYPSGYTDISDMKKKVEHLMIQESNTNFTSAKLVDFIKTISINSLYSEFTS